MHPAEQLKEEHKNILRGVKLLNITADYMKDGSILQNEIHLLVDFFRNYADQGHHAKEEEIFFEYLYKKDESFRGDFSPIATFRDDHIRGRKIVSSIERVDGDYPFRVNDYSMMLNRHIEMEDELFPMIIEDNLSEVEIQAMSEEFASADAKRDLASKLSILDKVEVFLI